MFFVMILFVILLAILGFSESATIASFKLVFLLLLALLFVASCAVAVGYKGIRRLRKKTIPLRCQLCLHCLYDLSARPRDDDTCPECGMIAPRRECVRLWCKLLRSRF